MMMRIASQNLDMGNLYSACIQRRGHIIVIDKDGILSTVQIDVLSYACWRYCTALDMSQ